MKILFELNSIEDLEKQIPSMINWATPTVVKAPTSLSRWSHFLRTAVPEIVLASLLDTKNYLNRELRDCDITSNTLFILNKFYRLFCRIFYYLLQIWASMKFITKPEDVQKKTTHRLLNIKSFFILKAFVGFMSRYQKREDTQVIEFVPLFIKTWHY